MNMVPVLARQLGVVVTDDMARAMAFLTSRGMQFLVDFGFDNALPKAHALWRREGVQ